VSAIEDTRKVLQDFLAPEIREIRVRLDALEKRMDERFDDMAVRLKHADALATARHDVVVAEIRGLSDVNDIRQRLSKLEGAKEALHQ
jgi:tetrahydromethanopterin S-methyltransferase subunit G